MCFSLHITEVLSPLHVNWCSAVLLHKCQLTMSRFEDNRSERESFYVKGFNSNYLGYDDNDADENDAKMINMQELR